MNLSTDTINKVLNNGTEVEVISFLKNAAKIFRQVERSIYPHKIMFMEAVLYDIEYLLPDKHKEKTTVYMDTLRDILNRNK